MVRFVFKDKVLGEKLVEHGESKDLLSEKFNKIKAKKKMPKSPDTHTVLSGHSPSRLFSR